MATGIRRLRRVGPDQAGVYPGGGRPSGRGLAAAGGRSPGRRRAPDGLTENVLSGDGDRYERLLPGSGHLVPVDAPDALAAIVAAAAARV